MEDNDYAVFNMIQSMENVRTYASWLSSEKSSALVEIDKLRRELRAILINHKLKENDYIQAKVREVKDFITALDKSLTQIGDKFEDVNDVIRAHRLYIWEQESDNVYWFNTPDGEISGRIVYNEVLDCYEVSRKIQIYDEDTCDWGFEYDSASDTITAI